jgi:putative Holliday junction resolvase
MRVLAVDLGERRIGLALSDPSGTLARPWRTLDAAPDPRRVAADLAAIAAQLAADPDGLAAIVLAYPRRLDGSPSSMTVKVDALAAALERSTAVPIVRQDERLSSREAESRLALRERDWRRRKRRLDAASAAVVLQDYLDERRGPYPTPPDLDLP